MCIIIGTEVVRRYVVRVVISDGCPCRLYITVKSGIKSILNMKVSLANIEHRLKY